VINVEQIIQTGGLLAIGAIVFAETGLLVGFFLPGDTLLFSAGIFAAAGKLNFIALVLTVIVCAIIGDNVGYQFGKKTGDKVFTKEDGIFFRKEYLEKAHSFYLKHGGKTIILARFVPVVRTFAPVVAGAGNMDQGSFMRYNMIGGIIWGGGVTSLGYFLGNRIPNVEHYIIPIFILANIITWGPVVWHILKDKDRRKQIVHKIARKKHL
jgi:membrane-associated protein